MPTSGQVVSCYVLELQLRSYRRDQGLGMIIAEGSRTRVRSARKNVGYKQTLFLGQQVCYLRRSNLVSDVYAAW